MHSVQVLFLVALTTAATLSLSENRVATNAPKVYVEKSVTLFNGEMSDITKGEPLTISQNKVATGTPPKVYIEKSVSANSLQSKTSGVIPKWLSVSLGLLASIFFVNTVSKI
jgi:hypothetical protein